METRYGLLLIAALLTVAFFSVLARKDPTSQTAPTGASSATSATPSAPGTLQSSAPASAPPQPLPEVSPSGDLARQATQSTNLRTFVESAKLRPREGGITYAVAALQYCQHWMDLKDKYNELSNEVAKSPGPTAVRRLAALNRMSAQCADFTADELGQAHSLRANGRAQDPLLKLQGQWFEYRRLSEQHQRALVLSTLAARDPYLLNAVGTTIGQQVVDGQAVVHFDGERFGGLASASDYKAAWSLVACRFGEDCSMSADVTTTCVFEGECYPSRQSLLRASFAGREAEFDRVVEVAGRLTDAVRRGQADRFFPTGASR